MNIIPSVFTQVAEQLTHEEKEAALVQLTAMVRAERAAAADFGEERPACPRCGSERTIAKGSQNGYRRRLCKGCGRTYSPKTGRVLALSKLPEEKWVAYVEHMLDGLTLKALAERVGVSLATSCLMRWRICEVMGRNTGAFRADAGLRAEVDETYFRESFAGNPQGSYELPRDSRSRGGECHKRGISNDLICVVTGVNELGDVFCDVTCRGRLGKDAARAVLEGRVAAGSIVATDGHPSYVGTVTGLGAAEHVRYDAKRPEDGAVSKANALHSRIELFLSRFRGVATKRLQLYMWWFQWQESFKRVGAGERARLAVEHVVNTRYEKRRKDYRGEGILFPEYYGARACEL